jgi:ABC-2 type transport system permease protein
VSAVAEARPSETAAFFAILRRDLYVIWRDPAVFLGQVIVQPLFLLFIFGKVLEELGYTQGDYAELLFPGLLALTAVLTSMQALAFPLVAEFGWTREIEDRLLAPIRTGLVAIEKLLIASVRALIATALMIPVGILVLGSIPWRWDATPLFVAVLILSALLGASLGLVLGTLVTPNRINIVFTLVLTPLLFTGASQYPWPSLESLRWFQIVTAANPMTYASEGFRAALVPSVPHIDAGISLAILAGTIVAFTAIGIRGFYRRAID